jgi:hypothetical protein
VFGKGAGLMRSLLLELKNQRGYCFVPVIVLFVLTPLVVLAMIKNGGSFPECCTTSQLFVTSFAAWWPLFLLKEYLDSPGKELLFVYKSSDSGLLQKMIVLWLCYLLLMVILFCYFSTLFGFVWYLLIAVAVQSLFMIALGYSLALLCQNTFIPLIVNFAYCSVFMLAVFYSPVSIFQNFGDFTQAADLSKSPVVALIALLLFYGGYQIEKRLYKQRI